MAAQILSKETAERFTQELGIKTKDPRNYLWRMFTREDNPWPHTQDGNRYWFDPERIRKHIMKDEHAA